MLFLCNIFLFISSFRNNFISIYIYVLFFVLIAHSLYFISEDDNSLTLLFVLELFHLTSSQPMSFILLS